MTNITSADQQITALLECFRAQLLAEIVEEGVLRHFREDRIDYERITAIADKHREQQLQTIAQEREGGFSSLVIARLRDGSYAKAVADAAWREYLLHLPE